jgi:thymidylate kinase
MHAAALTKFTLELTRQFEASGLRWCVLRNGEYFPQTRSDSSDMDLLVDTPMSKLRELVQRCISEAPVSLAKFTWKLDRSLLRIYVAVPGSPTLHIDLFVGVQWAGITLIPNRLLLDNVFRRGDAMALSSGPELATAFLVHWLHNGHVKQEHKERMSGIEVPGEFDDFVAAAIGKELATPILQALRARDWGAVEGAIGSVRRTLKLRSFARIPSRVVNLARSAVTVIERISVPSGLFICLMGPDGAGKSTVGQVYRDRLSTLFLPNEQKFFHWRPRVLPAPGQVAGLHNATDNNNAIDQPHGKPARGYISSVLRLSYFSLDYMIGYILRVLPVLARGGLCVFDRYFFDFGIDRYRYRLRVPDWLVEIYSFMIPKPDLTFVFDADPQVLRARKAELSLEEIDRQRSALNAFAASRCGIHVINVDRRIEAIVDEMEELTLAYLNTRNRRRFVSPRVTNLAEQGHDR